MESKVGYLTKGVATIVLVSIVHVYFCPCYNCPNLLLS